MDAALTVPLAKEGGGSFLVTPSIGLMIWTLVAFGITLYVLRKYAFPRIQGVIDERRAAIQESIDAAERTRNEADELLAEYRQRLVEARQQAEEILDRARRAGDKTEEEALHAAREKREELMELTRKDIAAETRRAIEEIRKEVADLTVMATEKVTRKTLTPEDQQRLLQEALDEVDFSALAGSEANGGKA